MLPLCLSYPPPDRRSRIADPVFSAFLTCDDTKQLELTSLKLIFITESLIRVGHSRVYSILAESQINEYSNTPQRHLRKVIYTIALRTDTNGSCSDLIVPAYPPLVAHFERPTMDVQKQPRDRIFSILNDNDCPSFVIRQQFKASSPEKQRSIKSPRLERPSLLRQTQFARNSSFSSRSPPSLLRYDSSSSSSSTRSHSSMESTPSPTTPGYCFNEPALLPYDSVLSNGYVPSPSAITPFMEQQMMISASVNDPFQQKLLPTLPALHQFPILSPPTQADQSGLPTPVSSHSTSTTTSVPPPAAASNPSPTSNAPAPKKNKYPCPYAQSHNCLATFTTSGHAARHGKKHTGEKGVHCPICNKAFTRKDNMKQHERTHKSSGSGSNSDESSNPRRSKAAVTQDHQKQKAISKQESGSSDLASSTSASMMRSPLSEVTSIAPVADLQTPLDAAFYPDPSVNQVMMPAIMPMSDGLSPNSVYPPLAEDAMLAAASIVPPMDKMADFSAASTIPMPPTLIRGFSDLDTLAQAAESFDPYYQTTM